MTGERRPDRTVGRMEIAVGLLATLLLVAIHVKVKMHAGALWRDEIQTLTLATESSALRAWELKEYDSFPMLWVMVMRAWISSGLGDTDPALRTLGLLVGLAIVGALWINGRWLGYGVPLLSLLFFAFSPTTFRFGDSLRAYGGGVLLLLIAMGAIWRLVQKPTAARAALAAVASILSVQCLYQNLVFVVALCVAGAAVGVRNRAWKPAVLAAGICLASALSLLPYLPSVMHRRRSWDELIRYPTVDPSWIFRKFAQAIGEAGGLVVWLWIAALVGAALVFIRRSFRRRGDPDEPPDDLALFAGTGLVLATASFVAFLLALGYPTEPWYYIAIMAFCAVSFDVAGHLAARRSKAVRLLRLVFFVAVALAISGRVWAAAGIRLTNIDAICSRLETAASGEDLIVVNPWMLGITFERYYKGSTPWATLPELRDHGIHRYDLIKEKMMESEPITPLLSRISQTLYGGHRVWLVQGLPFDPSGDPPGALPPAPRAPSGWFAHPYELVWSRQAAYWITMQAGGYATVPVRVPGEVNPYEDPVLVRVDGRRR